MRTGVMLTIGLLSGVTASAQEKEAHEMAEASEATKVAPALATALKESKVSLASGVRAAAKEGQPISGKFEVENGNLQLSVYTKKGDAFSEVIIDHKTGKISKSEPITSGDDLTAAKKQAEAMDKAKHTLADVIAGAEKSHPGFRAVSIMPEIENGAAQADVTLLKGSTSKQIDQPL